MRLPDLDIDLNAQVDIIVNGKTVACKKVGDDFWLVKLTECNHCGECCLQVYNSPFGHDEEGKCNALVKKEDGWLCGKFKDMPLRCIEDPTDPHDRENCSITYKKVMING